MSQNVYIHTICINLPCLRQECWLPTERLSVGSKQSIPAQWRRRSAASKRSLSRWQLLGWEIELLSHLETAATGKTMKTTAVTRLSRPSWSRGFLVRLERT